MPRFTALAFAALCAAFAACGGGDVGGGDNNDDALLEYADAGVPERPDPPTNEPADVCIPWAPVPSDQLPRCEAATKDCVVACPGDSSGDQCRSDCWANDPTPAPSANLQLNCQGCIFTQLLACIDAGPCHDAVSTHFCCVADACAAGEPQCDQQCPDTNAAMFTCAFSASPQCIDLVGGDVGLCYAEGTTP